LATRFIARQPILDRQRGVFAYELLFRNGTDGTGQVDPNLMASSTVDSALLFGVDNLTGRIRNILATLSALRRGKLGACAGTFRELEGR
jgi:c-di-GMP-related signal transduction protein